MPKTVRLYMTGILSVIICCLHAQQQTNLDPTQGYINVPLPKTPESEGIQQFGKIPVSEISGTPDISIPIYTVKSRFLQAPITLAYHPSGIKVSQEASWVGLGWDLNVGGRITIEQKGTLDFDPLVGGTGPYSMQNLRTMLPTLYSRLNNGNPVSVMTYATICRQSGNCGTLPWDDAQMLQDMVAFGAGEPDIFKANFMGHSITFYYDKITGNLNFLGEQSLFTIYKTVDSHGIITGWSIKDTEGATYTFSQAETTTTSISSSAIQSNSSTSAWLLTRVQHPTGDYIQFNYTNYGNSYPAFSWTSSVYALTSSGAPTTWGQSQDGQQVQTMLTPYYLTSIQTGDVLVQLSLGSRTDIYGPGSQRLNQITVTDLLTNKIAKTVTFGYDYFNASASTCFSSLASYSSLNYFGAGLSVSSYLAPYTQRLRLSTLQFNDLTAYQPPYQFLYNNLTIDKYSFSQDHWGYYNGVNNSSLGCAPQYLIPITTVGSTINVSQLNGNANRECNATAMQAMTLTNIVYPTGGSTSFVYEPHSTSTASGSLTGVTGGGLRIKTINNYATGTTLLNSTNYAYGPGVYMGTLQTFTMFTKTPNCVNASDPSSSGDRTQYTLSTNEIYNDNDMLVEYPTVTVTQTDGSGIANGSVLKTFNVAVPSRAYNGAGFELRTAHTPTNYPNVLTTGFFYPNASGLPPSFVGINGNLAMEQYYDNSSTLLKTVAYSYHQANFTQNFYDVKAIDNMTNGLQSPYTMSCAVGAQDFETNGNRSIIIFVTPGISYTTLLDGVTETNNLGGNNLVMQKTYTYNSHNMPLTMTVTNSDGTQTKSSYGYTYDQSSSTYSMMTAGNIISPVVSTTVTQGAIPMSYSINNYYNPSAGVYVPQNTQIQIGSNSLETRIYYNAFDAYGHLMEKQKPGDLKEDYVWGYDHLFPVAKVVGSDYSTIASTVSQSIINAPASDAALRTELNKLRALPNTLVTTFTYAPVFGMTSQTDPRGYTSYYIYDAYGRLSYIMDKDLNVVKRFAYDYAGQPLAATVTPFGNIYLSQTFTSHTCAAPGVPATYNYTANAGTFTSFVDQATANQMATNAGQAAADALGCVPAGVTVATGYTAISNSIVNNGTTATMTFGFYPNTSAYAIYAHQSPAMVGTVTAPNIPLHQQTIMFSSSGKNWTVSIYPSGQMYWQLTSSTSGDLNALNTVGTTFTYSLQ